MLGDMFDETPLESAGKNLLFVIQKNVDAFVLQLSDYTGTHVHYLFVFIGQPLIQNSLARAILWAKVSLKMKLSCITDPVTLRQK
mgnify:CR=1 FL=1